MKRAISSVLACALALSAAWPATAITPATRGRSAAQVPTRPSAPLSGVVTSIDAARHVIAINTQKYLIGAPLLALIDKRPKNDGLLTLDKVVPGMAVQYRAESVPDGTRVVELWVMRDAETRRPK